MEIVDFFIIIAVFVLIKECIYYRKAFAMKRRYLLFTNVAKLVSEHGTKNQKTRVLHLLMRAVHRPHHKHNNHQHLVAFALFLVLNNLWLCICATFWGTSEIIQLLTLGVAMISNLQFIAIFFYTRLSRLQRKAAHADSKV